MHDIKTIRADGPAFDAALARRGVAPVSARVLDLDQRVRGLKTDAERAVAAQNDLARQVGRAKGQGDEALATRLLAEVAALKAEAGNGGAAIAAIEAEQRDAVAVLPNLPAAEVPEGLDETGNAVVHECGTKPVFDFAPKEHDALAVHLGYDPDQAAAIAGARFAVLKGPLARLHRALGQFMLDAQVANGFTEVVPPLLVLEKSVFGVGQLPKFEEDLFKTTDGRYLISTSEVSLTNLVREKILDADELPLRFTALTPCFRSEAGSAGRDTRGLIRQHQFEKVEMVSIVADQAAATQEHERMAACAEGILDALGLAYRRMLLCAGDMGFASRKTFDLEVWLPGQGQYREISSVSDCGDFQARRMEARWKTRGAKGTNFVHTLNGSGLAVGRTLVAVLENYQQADGSVRVPEALVPWMGGATVLEPSK
ncbi:serine--tRNA ligase [Glacieibacterium frigidum]|uniref:Serine--tRNA ligase n=1 Tax=Glacieibacterium frigidum TaxID=2593303 RepID=A0A552UH68_9SPHN|nr:serine--tRNA ligase [Glacieibacterium frigidum]TRW17573.1 serine--tRNA ligase [Glacieibacterium frigidum]